MVNANLRWLNNVSGVYLGPDFLAFYWSAGFGTILQVLALASHWLKDYANFTQTPEENDQYSVNDSYSAIHQQANPLLSINNF
jgi:hypothetical protein